MLCYSNRAATRISLGRMRDAIEDCMMAIAIDPNFFKVQVRAAKYGHHVLFFYLSSVFFLQLHVSTSFVSTRGRTS